MYTQHKEIMREDSCHMETGKVGVHSWGVLRRERLPLGRDSLRGATTILEAIHAIGG